MIPPNDQDFEEGSDEQLQNYIDYNGGGSQIGPFTCFYVMLSMMVLAYLHYIGVI